jgi:hypothetical protein
MAQFHIDRFYHANVDQIWQFLADFEAKKSQKIQTKILETGDASKNQAGLVREMKYNGTRIREKILSVTPKESIEYQLLAGVPVHDYFGTVFVYPEREGTTVRWVVTFKSNFPWPEWLIKKRALRYIEGFLDDMQEALKD